MSTKSKRNITEPIDELCVFVKKIREQMEVSQEEFAELLNISSQSVSRFERGAQVPRAINTLWRLRHYAETEGFADAVRLIDRALAENGADRPEPAKPVACDFTEWRLVHLVHTAAELFPETITAIEAAAAPAVSLVDGVLRAAKPDQMDAVFYQGLERALAEAIQQEKLRRFQKKGTK